MSLTQDQIKHLAKLTALREGSINISNVIDSFEMLGAIDTKSVTQIHRSGKGSLSLRPDTVISDANIPDQLLACSNQKKAAHQIVLSGIMHGE